MVNNIICFDDENGGNKAYCSQPRCGGLLVQISKDGDYGCSLCEYIYRASETKLHKKRLIPDDEEADPILVPMTNYNANKNKIPTQGEIEDLAMTRKKSWFYFTDVAETHYE